MSSQCMAFGLLIAVCTVGVANSATFQIPVKHFEGRFKTALRQGMIADYEKEINDARKITPDLKLPMSAFKDIEYVGIVSVGNPEQNFSVALDSLSSNFWLPDKSCDINAKCNGNCQTPDFCAVYCDEYCCGEGASPDIICDQDDSSTSDSLPYADGNSSEDENDEFANPNTVDFKSAGTSRPERIHSKTNLKTKKEDDLYYYDEQGQPRVRCHKSGAVQSTCETKRRFFGDKSSTFKDLKLDFSLKYGADFVQGIAASDTLRFGESGNDRLSVPALRFGLATTMSKHFRGSYFDGYLGLGSQKLSAGNFIPPLLRAVQLRMAKPIFTIYLAKDATMGGLLTLGGVDEANCQMSRISYADMMTSNYYEFQLDKICVGSKCERAGPAVSDIGTATIVGPPKIVERIAKLVGAEQASDGDYYTIDCTANYNINFTINSRQYGLTRETLSINVGLPGGRCLFGMRGIDLADTTLPQAFTWILGDPFLRAYCNVYDFGSQSRRMGFAPVKRVTN